MDVVCVGDCGVDLYLPAGERRCGGITANFARHARAQFPPGDSVRIVSCIGRDEGARLVSSCLADSGIECHIRQLPGITPIQTIEIREDGEKDFVQYETGVLRDFRFGPTEVALIAGSDLLVAPVFLQIVGLFDDLMEIDTKGRVSIDFADFLEYPDFALLERHLESIDVGFFGLTAGDVAMIERIRGYADRRDKTFVVTLGANGSLVFAGGRQFRQPAEPVQRVVDTTGAGDAYAAGFLSRFCHGAGIEASMKHGAALAATVVTKKGSF